MLTYSVFCLKTIGDVEAIGARRICEITVLSLEVGAHPVSQETFSSTFQTGKIFPVPFNAP